MFRSLQRQDIPDVCALFARTFRTGKNHDRAALAAAIEATYFTAPDYSEERGSVVHIDDQGKLTGFAGVINIKLRLGARTLHAAVLSSYMADQPETNPMVGVGLIRKLFARNELVFGDTANRTSLDISRAMRFEILPFHSLEWLKILKPAGTAVYFLGRRGARWSRALIQPAAVFDAMLPRFAATDIDARSIAKASDRPITEAEFITAAPELVASYM